MWCGSFWPSTMMGLVGSLERCLVEYTSLLLLIPAIKSICKCFQELRVEDYIANRKGKQPGSTTGFGFSTPATQNASYAGGFGTSGGFGTASKCWFHERNFKNNTTHLQQTTWKHQGKNIKIAVSWQQWPEINFSLKVSFLIFNSFSIQQISNR